MRLSDKIILFLKENKLVLTYSFFAIVGAFAIIIITSSVFNNHGGSERKRIIEFAKKDPVSLNTLISNVDFDYPEIKRMDDYITNFINKWDIKGASLAIIKDNKLAYAKGYGWANKENSIQMEPGHVLRTASLSKLITATAIMKLQEDSLLNISDKVFGPGAILDLPEFRSFKDKRVQQITVENLLRHQSGFTIYNGDPMFMTREIIIWEKLDRIPTSDDVISFCLNRRLGFTPGHSSSYSNVGYLILSRIIERVSGMSYEEYCQENVLNPAGCYDMHIGTSFYHTRRDNEVRYYEVEGALPIQSYDNSGKLCSHSYGGNNISGLQGAGAWVASPIEFATFINHIDNNPEIADILSSESITSMLNRRNGRLPIGWSKGSLNGTWTRTGSLAGTSAVARKHKDGSIWVFITNSSAWKGSKFTKNIESLLDGCHQRFKPKSTTNEAKVLAEESK